MIARQKGEGGVGEGAEGPNDLELYIRMLCVYVGTLRLGIMLAMGVYCVNMHYVKIMRTKVGWVIYPFN